MPTVELDASEWNQVISIIAGQPWTLANPLLLKISGQLRVQALQPRDSAGVPGALDPYKRPRDLSPEEAHFAGGGRDINVRDFLDGK